MSSYLTRHRPKFVIGGILGCIAIGGSSPLSPFIFLHSPPTNHASHLPGLQVLPYLRFPAEVSTPGTRNIENRFSSGGAAKDHTPAVGTKRGDKDVVVPKAKTGSPRGTEKWDEKIEQQVPEVCKGWCFFLLLFGGFCPFSWWFKFEDEPFRVLELKVPKLRTPANTFSWNSSKKT